MSRQNQTDQVKKHIKAFTSSELKEAMRLRVDPKAIAKVTPEQIRAATEALSETQLRAMLEELKRIQQERGQPAVQYMQELKEPQLGAVAEAATTEQRRVVADELKEALAQPPPRPQAYPHTTY